MKVVIASDSFKGSASSLEVASAIERGIKKADKSIEVKKFPISDGGEGLIEVVESLQGYKKETITVKDPLFRDIQASYIRNEKTAFIEMAAASGLPLVEETNRNPLNTTTFGTGQLIKDALDKGILNLVIGIGGSATNDGGIGMLNALGAKFFDKDKNEVSPIGKNLAIIESFDFSALHKSIPKATISVACDVDNPLCGINGASYIYGPQKGADKKSVEFLDQSLLRFSKLVNKEKEALEAGSGAAGGLGFALLSFLNAELKSGIELVLTAIGFEKALLDADLVITGEGKIDGQSKRGKVPVGVAKIAKKFNVPVIALAGDIGKGTESLYDLGIDGIVSTTSRAMPLEEAMKNSLILTEEESFRLWKILQIQLKNI
ncbi:MAG: glycerate kinase [Sphaerochaetaceae bacterium]|nr:glycerate kinase [Sphaerochaetaceae bacterium]